MRHRQLSIFILLLGFIFFCENGYPKAWINQSHKMFFPKDMAAVAEPYERFPVFWWNFIAFDSAENRENICNFIQNSNSVTISGCRGQFTGLQSVLSNWVSDYPTRAEAPSQSSWSKMIQQARAQATLPGSGQLLWLLRIDPFQSYLDLKKRTEKNIDDIDTNFSGKNILPVQFNFAPSETKKTQEFMANIKKHCALCGPLQLAGPHASVLENESQIKKDLITVNTVSLFLTILMIGLLIYFKRQKLLNIILPLGMAIFLGAVVTVLVYGSIHSLTLAFGVGLVGLAVDYGLHSAFWPRAWRPNIYGLLTTLAVFGTATISDIPLLRQMMFFGAVGLTIAFVILFGLFKFKENWFSVEPYSYVPATSPLRFGFALFCAAGVLYGALFMRPNFDMRLFDYQGVEMKKMQEVIKTAYSRRPLMIEVLPQHTSWVEAEQSRYEFAQSHNIEFESIAKYVPSLTEQNQHLKSWRLQFCPERTWRLAAEEEEFAEPLFRQFSCNNFTEKKSTTEYIPAYAQHLYSEGDWVHLWFPKNADEANAIRGVFPKVLAIEDVAKIFARSLSQDILIILPIAILGVLFLLSLEFRKWRLVILASLPFFSGAGLMLWFFAFVGWPISFMSLIGLVMVCGFSVDYGIFVTDALVFDRLKSAQGLWSALAMCGVFTVGGFLPMVFGQHPVLQHLGFSLLMGTIGTYVGTVWGILGFAKYIFKMDVTKNHHA